MSYEGAPVPIPMGQGGLHTDDAQPTIPPTDLIKANNITLFSNKIEKAAGSQKFNDSALSDEIVGLFDWFPDPQTQRLIAVTADGNVYRDIGDKTFSSSTPIESSLGSLDPNIVMVEGGAEVAGNNKKLFLFTGNRQLKVLSGDGMSMADVTSPSADWSTSFPTGGLIHRGRLFAWLEHNVYGSLATDHEDFADASSLLFNVFPGESDKIIGGFVYKGRMFVLKYPYGTYFLNDNDVDSANWYFQKLSGSFGVSSTNGFVQAMDDMLVGNSSGTITSMKAADTFGDIESGDILSILRIENYIRENTSATGISTQHAVYYEAKKMALFTYRSTTGTSNDRILTVDLNKQGQPRAIFSDRDQASCLALRRDSQGIKRPIYGDSSGFVYIMDHADRVVGTTGFTGEFQIPYIDFGFVDPAIANKRKLFDFLEVVFEPSGSWNMSVDVYIDDKLSETIDIPMIQGDRYDSATFDSSKFSLEEPQLQRKKLHGSGRRISLRCYNSNAYEYFKIVQIGISFRLADEAQTRV